MRWTPKSTKQLTELRKSGYNHTEIAEKMCISKKQVSSKILYIDNHTKDISKPRRREKHLEEVKEVNYAICVVEPIKRAREVFGNRFKQKFSGYYTLDGKHIKIGAQLKEAIEAEESRKRQNSTI